MKISPIFVSLALSATVSVSAFAIDASFNLVVDPEENGSSIAGNINCNWDGKFRSLLNLSLRTEMSTINSMPGFGTAIQSTETQTSQLDILPLALEVPIGDLQIEISTGASGIFLNERVSALFNDKDGLLLDPAGQYVAYSNRRNATIFSPRIGIAVSGFKIASLRFLYKGFVSPIYFISMDQTMTYDFLAIPSTNHHSRWSSPYMEQELAVDFLGFGRAVIEHSWQRLDFQTLDWNSNGDGLLGVDDIQSISELRLGIELLLPIRMGSVRFKGGVFWINSSISSSHWQSLEQKSRVAFRFGVEG